MPEVDTQTILNIVDVMKSIKGLLGETHSPYLPVYSALGGAFVGAVATVIPTSITAWRKDIKETKTLTLAIYAEIKAIIELIKLRSYFDFVNSIVHDMETGKYDRSTFQIIVPEDYCAVYKNNVCSIGKIESSLLVKIVQFYQLTDAVTQDVKPGGLLNAAPRGIEPFRNLLNVGTLMVAIGQEVVSAVEDKYGLMPKESSRTEPTA